MGINGTLVDGLAESLSCKYFTVKPAQIELRRIAPATSTAFAERRSSTSLRSSGSCDLTALISAVNVTASGVLAQFGTGASLASYISSNAPQSSPLHGKTLTIANVVTIDETFSKSATKNMQNLLALIALVGVIPLGIIIYVLIKPTVKPDGEPPSRSPGKVAPLDFKDASRTD